MIPVTILLLCLCTAFGFAAADRWLSAAPAQGLDRVRQERAVLMGVSAFTALSALFVGP